MKNFFLKKVKKCVDKRLKMCYNVNVNDNKKLKQKNEKMLTITKNMLSYNCKQMKNED